MIQLHREMRWVAALDCRRVWIPGEVTDNVDRDPLFSEVRVSVSEYDLGFWPERDVNHSTPLDVRPSR